MTPAPCGDGAVTGALTVTIGSAAAPLDVGGCASCAKAAVQISKMNGEEKMQANK